MRVRNHQIRGSFGRRKAVAGRPLIRPSGTFSPEAGEKGRCRAARRQSGFTLVEMLISVALVLLMMSLFATIFQMAAGTVEVQRGVMTNDQSARALQTVIRSDFSKRTFRYVLPFHTAEDDAISITPFGSRAGYLYLSMNNPESGLDDVVQFTINIDVTTTSDDGTPVFGRASQLRDRVNDIPPVSPTAAELRRGMQNNPNQPEADDGSQANDFTARSRAAEITLFVRNGNLYRSVMLLRDPLPIAGQDLDNQPTSRPGENYFDGNPDPMKAAANFDGKFSVWGPGGVFSLSDDFWQRFDMSAFRAPTPTSTVQFVGVEDLGNETNGSTFFALGKPNYRFGFDFATGLSREHTSDGSAPGLYPLKFLGRYLRAETSSTNFRYPQRWAHVEVNNADSIPDSGLTPLGGVDGNVMSVVNVPVRLNRVGVVSEFDSDINPPATDPQSSSRGGARRMEDLLMANVHEMRVEIWDDKLQRYTYPGHTAFNPSTGLAGDYHATRRLNAFTGPLNGPQGNGFGTDHVFDTWHPQTLIDADASGTADPNQSPPFLPLKWYPPRATAGAYPLDGPSPPGMLDSVADWWTPDTPYGVGDVVFGSEADAGLHVNYEPYTDDNGNGQFDWGEEPSPGFHMIYRCISAIDGGDPGTATTSTSGPPPTWPTQAGRVVTDNELIWEAIDNRLPLRSLRITFRFIDPASDQMRQTSVMVPLVD